jgi:putative ABC transport system substrate-binding protein
MQKVDALWTVADSGVFTPQTTPTLLLAALRHRMPLIGLSPGHVRSGALAALVVDYEEVGRQTAELVVRVLEAPSSEVPVTAPRRVTLALNLKTAELLGLQIPKELLEEARIVVR